MTLADDLRQIKEQKGDYLGLLDILIDQASTLPFPMPNDKIGDATVLASVEYFDDERGAVSLVLLLEQTSPFFTVAHYARTDVRSNDETTAYKAGEVDVIGRFWNIVEAVREYEQSGGDY
jgi:hypothetical protein